ncbi:DNA (cytosine-5-)-methyltransferase [Tenacibaculum finnmarkense genomovar finnmarkense]|uniref:DNA cytosine methyltransferase n=3 Tax=Tenacibaculum finnmarkense TaxID=2781243 RepID=UPI001E6109B2|nr:DNA (cytosine-5-)-methyltransferase [Tenacibaculum finnmarkense]MCD8418720.1 DNA (cytosine-5-)-methyltransferase [Tenacibaculum finnmarkense genomovar finnmarkense]MCG8187038.1 DNA (cytosine-5-)-methyltransferase [Tenacibaculum finnmarkense genomovar finnmarkense]MCG8203566.1 DNA (cytosine-5-)-methyltransferase [Tenacibaculum finnmarkense genomovar finnmarkense]MCG8211069.1 DNA (cytosine-5-)-methyltransferase [Tenacibaculum finnmarkense genomovar finnmarkense]MCG8213833.1 DNA (cytosine-5-)-
MENKKMKVAELFAGVGGFRLGLEKSNYEIVWSNQWEPSTKMQHASKVYEERFGKENHSNEDINEVVTRNVEEIPDHDLLVGGFPCQDYSVATTLHNSKGLKGKKGVLWWSIHQILEKKKNKPKYLFLENVDRLLKSPAKQRGRDFAVMLQSLNDLGYAVEWRVINAAEYGMPQRRRRVFFIGYHKSTEIYKRLQKSKKINWLTEEGTIANAFPVAKTDSIQEVELKGDLVEITNDFNKNGKLSPFQNTGLLIKGKVYTTKTVPNYDGERTVLGDVLQNGEVTSEFFIDEKDKDKWEYLKGAKTIERKSPDGFVYKYSEGGMIYPDALDNASRTIITGEGGKSASRFKHVIVSDRGLRRLTPIELERLNMFPDNHTELEGITDTKRAFFMGNALVVGVIEKIGEELYKQINQFEYV